MKTILLFLIFLIFLLFSLNAIGQVSPVQAFRIPNYTSTVGTKDIPMGSEIFVVSDSTKWIAKVRIPSGTYMSAATSSCIPVTVKLTGTLPITISGSAGRRTIGVNTVTTGASGVMSVADKIKLDGIATGATANVGTVTSVDMSVPTGLTISGRPITVTGTLALTYTSGYSIPTTANQAIWTAKQPALSGTGFVKISGTTISYDNSTYITSDTKWDGGSTGLIASTGRTSLQIPFNVQALSGTNPSWVGTSGLNATLTLSGNTVLTLSALVAGQTGNIRVVNPSTYTLTVSGYTNKISTTAYSTTNKLRTSGSNKIDVFSWWYDGTYLIWNGTLDYKN